MIKELMESVKQSHSKSVDYRRSLSIEDLENMKIAFNISFRLSEILNDLGKIRLNELGFRGIGE